jgi:Aminoglycoside-2''-adenylyltransferase
METIEPDLSKWDAWRPEEVARLLSGVGAPWYIAGGWAIDLFLAEERRRHADLEIAVPAARFGEVAAALREFELFVVTGPRTAVALELVRDRLSATHQTWVREPASHTWRLDVFREPSDGDTWICRRDPSIRLPYSQLVEWTEDGIPYGRPEVVLLFKAKRSHEEKNQNDFAAVLPRLGADRRRWLREAIARVHPGHRWIHELGTRAA